MQKILNDNFLVNIIPITVSAATFQLPESCFNVPEGKPFEFFLSLAVDPVTDPMNEIQQVNLMSGTTVLAQASFDEDADVLNRHYTLFYKGVAGAGGQDFFVQLKTAGGTTTQINTNNLQLGVKIYEDTYPLTTTTLPTC